MLPTSRGLVTALERPITKPSPLKNPLDAHDAKYYWEFEIHRQKILVYVNPMHALKNAPTAF